MEEQSLGSSNSLDSAYDSETKQQHDFHERNGGVSPGNLSSTSGEQKGSMVTVMGAFLNKKGSVISMASMFERASLTESQQQQTTGENRTKWSPARANLQNSISTSLSSPSMDCTKSPPVNVKEDEHSSEGDDDVFSCPSTGDNCQRTSLRDSVTSATSNTSQMQMSKEQKHTMLEDKPSAVYASVSTVPPMKIPKHSATKSTAAKSGPLWSAPRRKKQIKNVNSSSSLTTDQPHVDTNITHHSARSRESRRHRLSYDNAAAAGSDLASFHSQSGMEGIRQTLKKSYTETDLFPVRAPKVTVSISSKKVDDCQVDTVSRYRQTSRAKIQVTGDSEFD